MNEKQGGRGPQWQPRLSWVPKVPPIHSNPFQLALHFLATSGALYVMMHQHRFQTTAIPHTHSSYSHPQTSFLEIQWHITFCRFLVRFLSLMNGMMTGWDPATDLRYPSQFFLPLEIKNPPKGFTSVVTSDNPFPSVAQFFLQGMLEGAGSCWQ